MTTPMAVLKKILVVALAGLLLYLAVRGVDWRGFVQPLQRVDARWVAAAMAVQLAAFILRGQRWGILLSPVGGTLPVGFAGVMLGYLGNTFLPARAGEVIRIGAVATRLSAPVGFVAGTAAAERVSDAIAVSLAAFVLVQTVTGAPAWLVGAATLFGTAGIGLLVALAFLDRVLRRVFPPLRRLPLVGPLMPRIEHVLLDVEGGVRALTESRTRLARYLALTVAVWCCDGIVVLLLTHAFGATLAFAQAMMLVTGLALASAVPSTPGYIGVTQFVAVSVLVPFGFSQELALAAIVVLQGTVVAQVTLWGTLGWAVLAGRRRKGRQPVQ